LRNFDYRGRHSYFLTFCAYRRREAFHDPAVASMVVDQILSAAARFDFAVFAYCVMPDHAHLLVRGKSPSSELKRFSKRVKQSSGQIHRRRTGGPLWQEGYFDRIVWPEEDLSGIARYIIENPVRSGLVAAATDYPFAGSQLWSIEEILRRDVVMIRTAR
jgi:REP element-mobilizing transposase RayT